MAQNRSLASETFRPADGAAGDRERALKDLRAARRRRYFDSLAWMDTLYRLYLTAIFGGVAIALVSGALGDARADAHAVNQLSVHGPALIGVLVALAVAAGWRAGGRGGPLAIEAADVQHVLLAPIDRSAYLRRIAVRRLGAATFTGAVVGLVVGNLAFRRLPGPTAEWLACDAAFGALVPLATLSVAMIASGLRLRQRTVDLLALLIVGAAVVNVAFDLGSNGTNAGALGELAIWPLRPEGESLSELLPTLLIVLTAAALGLHWVGGISLAAARRRAALTEGLRFAITLHDVRAVILLRRQLAAERPRRRPWKRLDPAARIRQVVWRRDWQSFLRWPAVRLARVGVLGVIAGLALCGAWSGTTPLVVVAGLALFVASLDAVEPLAQELDHPTRAGLLPLAGRVLAERHLVAPTALMLGVALVAVASAAIVAQDPLALEVGAVIAVPSGFLLVCCGAVSVTNDPLKYLLTPAFGYAQTAAPMVLSVLAVLPVIAAREAALRGGSPAVAAALAAALATGFSAVAIWELRRRMAERLPVR